MTLPVSLVLIAIGAILVWGVEADAEGLNIGAVGVILMIVGLLGFLLSLLFWDRWGWGRPGPWSRRTYVEGEPVVRRRYVEPTRRTTVVEEEADDVPPPGPPP